MLCFHGTVGPRQNVSLEERRDRGIAKHKGVMLTQVEI